MKRLLFLALVALVAIVSRVSAIVVGLDIGHNTLKVSLVKPGQSFQIVSNVASKRKTPTMLAFYGGERLFGSDAEALAARRPRQVFSDPHRVLGRNASHPIADDYLTASYNAVETTVNARGGIDFVVPVDEGGANAAAAEEAAKGKEPSRYSAEEMLAQFLAHAKDFTEVHAGAAVRDAVITVPAYYTQNERVALLDAAELAGFSVLALVDENTAAGVHYGIDRVTENGTHYMMLYNMGYESTQVTLFAYDSYMATERGGGKPRPVGQGRVVAKAWDTRLGGRWFDMALVEAVADSFNKEKGSKLPASAKGDVRNVPSAMVKIRKNVAKAKEILSANEEYPIVWEGLVGDIDFRTTVSRASLVDAAEKYGLWPRVTAVIEKVMAQSGLPLSDVSVVEVVGGAVRMPKIQTILRDYLAKAEQAITTESGAAGTVGPTLGVHLNGDEAMALGAAFVAANKSAAFRVRKVGMIDGFPFPIGVRLSHLAASTSEDAAADASSSAASSATATDDDAAEVASSTSATGTKVWAKRSSLFRVYNPLDSTKRISFPADKDLRAVMFYENEAVLPEGTSRTLGVYSIVGVEAVANNATWAALGTPKVHISFRLDHNGIATLVKAEATLEEDVLVPEATPKPKRVSKANATASASASPAADGSEAEEGAEASASPSADADAEGADAAADAEAGEEGAADTAADADASASPSPAADATATPEPKMKLVKKTHRFPLNVTYDAAATNVAVRPMTAADKVASLARLRKLKAADEEKRRLESAKNALESYIYAAREKRDTYSEEIEAVTTEEQREAISNALMEAEEWLYGDGDAADLPSYISKLRGVKNVTEPAFYRQEQARERPGLVEEARAALAASDKLIAGWNQTHPHITLEETETALSALDTFEEWLNTTSDAQDALAPHETPVLTTELLASKSKVVMELIMKLTKKPKPTPTPSPKASPTSSAKKSSSSSSKKKKSTKGKKGAKGAKATAAATDADAEANAAAAAAEAEAAEGAETAEESVKEEAGSAGTGSGEEEGGAAEAEAEAEEAKTAAGGEEDAKAAGSASDNGDDEL